MTAWGYAIDATRYSRRGDGVKPGPPRVDGVRDGAGEGEERWEGERAGAIKTRRESDGEDKVPIYCPLNGLPPEYCEYYPDYDKTRPWIAEHCPHLLKGEDEAGDVGKKGKRGGGVIKKKTISADKQKVIISKEVRNKKKAVTSVEGLETFSVKLKDAAKVFGKKFAASSSVKEKDSGGQEIVIQGDVIWDLPALLEKEYKIPKSKIFEREKGGKLSKVR